MRHPAAVSPRVDITYAVAADVLVLAVHDQYPFRPFQQGDETAAGAGRA